MKRFTLAPRKDQAQKLEAIGLSFHAWDGYWNEGACYEFTEAQILHIESATEELHAMCKDTLAHLLTRGDIERMAVPRPFWDAIGDSWKRQDFSLYGRFDLAYDGKGPAKMLEYNADTPTSLLESAVAQWYWMEEMFPDADQFNSLHEKLVARWRQMPGAMAPGAQVHFASLGENEEDWVCSHYLMETAIQAGLGAKHLFIEGLGHNPDSDRMLDDEDAPIDTLFKLYPWEWMMREEFAPHILTTKTRFIEPLWKSLLSNKALLPLLWERHKGHPNLLPAFFEEGEMKSFAKKPFYSREGANTELRKNGERIAADTGPYGAEGFIYQELVELPNFAGRYPVIGSWVVGDEPAGMCLRDDSLKITTNMSNFVPHIFK